MKLRSLFAVEPDAGVITAAGAALLALGAGIGAGVRWVLTRKDGNEKTLAAGLWDMIHAKDEQLKIQEANCEEMKATFNSLVIELNRTRLKHSRCEAKILELRQFAVMQHGTLKRLVAISADPNMYVAELPDFREEDWEIDDQSRAVDKQVKEVAQNAALLEASKKASASSLQLPPMNGGKP